VKAQQRRGLVNDSAHEVGRGSEVNRNDRDTMQDTAPKDLDPLGAVLRPEDNVVAFGCARLLESIDNRSSASTDFAVSASSRAIAVRGKNRFSVAEAIHRFEQVEKRLQLVPPRQSLAPDGSDGQCEISYWKSSTRMRSASRRSTATYSSVPSFGEIETLRACANLG
jgi:hypothetical protein